MFQTTGKLMAIALTLVLGSINSAQACPIKATSALDYQRRDNNRCEGIRRANVSGAFGLISFASRQLPSGGNSLSLKIPAVNSQRPTVTVQARKPKLYWLNQFEAALRLDSPWYQFSWPAQVIQNAAISRNQIRAIAQIPGPPTTFVPVILGQSSGQYEFVFFSAKRATVSEFHIQRNGQSLYRTKRPNPSAGELRFQWNARNAPKGRHSLLVKAQVEQRVTAPEPVNLRFQLEHDPAWLR